MFTCLQVDAAQYDFLMTKKTKNKTDQVAKSGVNPPQDIKIKWQNKMNTFIFSAYRKPGNKLHYWMNESKNEMTLKCGATKQGLWILAHC